MSEPARAVPVQILNETIKFGYALPDPRGSTATMHYSQLSINGNLYNLEVLYNSQTNTIFHFKYTRKPIGNLPGIPKINGG